MKKMLFIVLIVVFSQLLFAQYVMEWQSPYGYGLATDDDSLPRDITMGGNVIVMSYWDATNEIGLHCVYDINTFELLWSYQTTMWFYSFAYITGSTLPEVILYYRGDGFEEEPATVAIVNMTTNEEVIIVDSQPGVYPKSFIRSDGDGHDKLILAYYEDYDQPLYTEIWGDGSSSTTSNVIPNMDASLRQNFPNPFNPLTTINYSLKKSGNIELKIYNVKGQLVDTLINEYQDVDTYSVIWSPKKISSGMYFYQISIDGNPTEAKKAICIK